MSSLAWEVLLIALVGFVPVLVAPLSRRSAAWLLIALIPLHQYHKSFFLTVQLAGQSLQWPTLSKDLAYLLLFVYTLTTWLLCDRRRLWQWCWRLSCVLIGLAGLSLAAGSGVGQTLMGLRLYVFWPAVGILVGSLLLRDPHDTARLMRLLGLGCGVVAIVALIQALFEPNFMVHPAMRQLWAGAVVDWFTYRDRLRGPFTSANTLGLFMAMGILCWAILCSRPVRDRGRDLAMSWFALPACLAVLFLAESRTALFGCVVGLIALGARRGAGVTRRLAVGGAVGAGAALVFAVGLDSRFIGLLSNPRLIYWATFLASTVASPRALVLGQGLGSTGRYGVETQVAVDSADSLAGVVGGEGLFFVDSVYIRALFELGVIGLVPLVWLVLRSIRLIRVRSTLPNVEWEANSRGALLAFLLFASVLTETLLTYPWNVIGWALASARGVGSGETQARVPSVGPVERQKAIVVP